MKLGGGTMAYVNYLAVVNYEQIVEAVGPARVALMPTHVSAVSHFLTYSVEVQPLGRLLIEALDGGHGLDPELWHPLRPPKFHSPEATRRLCVDLELAWSNADAADPARDAADWYRIEITKVLRSFGAAAARRQS